MCVFVNLNTTFALSAHTDSDPCLQAICCPKSGVSEAIEISYVCLFAYNGAYPLFGFSCCPAGYHQGDFEHCTVRLHMDGSLAGVW